MAFVEGRERRIQHAVDPIFGQDLAVLGLDVDVGGAPLGRAQDQRIHQAHDGTLGRQRVEIDDALALVVGQELKPQRLARLLQQDVASTPAAQGVGHARRRGDHGVDGPLEEELEIVDAMEVGQVAEGDDEAPAGTGEGRAGQPPGGRLPARALLVPIVLGFGNGRGQRVAHLSHGSAITRRAPGAAPGSWPPTGRR
jgi:hypothetical protein